VVSGLVHIWFIPFSVIERGSVANALKRQRCCIMFVGILGSSNEQIMQKFMVIYGLVMFA